MLTIEFAVSVRLRSGGLSALDFKTCDGLQSKIQEMPSGFDSLTFPHTKPFRTMVSWEGGRLPMQSGAGLAARAPRGEQRLLYTSMYSVHETFAGRPALLPLPCYVNTILYLSNGMVQPAHSGDGRSQG